MSCSSFLDVNLFVLSGLPLWFDEQGQPIEIVDRLADRLRASASRQRDEPLAFVSDRELFGDLVDDPRFVESYLGTLDSLYAVGSRATLEKLVSSVGR